jgi:hypothetical protein
LQPSSVSMLKRSILVSESTNGKLLKIELSGKGQRT